MTASASPLLAVYVHWPFCARLCPYCDFNIHLDRKDESAALIAAILSDLSAQAARFDLVGPVGSVFFGGGTPSLMRPGDVAAILEHIDTLWRLAPEAELCLEANPDLADSAAFAGFRAAGIERVSLGVQALDDAALKFLGRTHTAAGALSAIDQAAEVFPRVSVDLIYARPGQTVAAWQDELCRALALPVSHLSLYELTIEPQTAFGRQVARGRWTPPSPDLRADLFEATHAFCAASGFAAYEVSNFARGKAARSVHNMAYWQAGEWVGVGPGAHGRVSRDGIRCETETLANPTAYARAIAGSPDGAWQRIDPMTAAEVLQERLLLGLRLVEGMNPPREQDLLAWPDLAAQFQRLQAQELVTISPDGRWQVLQSARGLTDGIAAQLAGAVG